MTESEALEKLKANLECQKKQVYGRYEDCNSDKCDDCELCYKQGNNGERIESTNMAIQALEKQIPKKPVHDGCLDNEGMWHEWNGVNGRPYDLCPNCNTNLCCEMPYDNKPKYCKHCGQRLIFINQ